MQEEIDGMDNYLSNGFVDTFRMKNGDAVKYSWWSYRSGARPRNIGWRIDYFFINQDLVNNCIDADIHDDVMGSDHCPVSLELDF